MQINHKGQKQPVGCKINNVGSAVFDTIDIQVDASHMGYFSQVSDGLRNSMMTLAGVGMMVYMSPQVQKE